MFALLSPLCVFGSSILRRKLAFITVVILPLFHTSCTILWNFEIKCPFSVDVCPHVRVLLQFLSFVSRLISASVLSQCFIAVLQCSE